MVAVVRRGVERGGAPKDLVGEYGTRQPLVGLTEAGDVKAHQVASPHGTCKAKEEKRPVADTEARAAVALPRRGAGISMSWTR